MDLNNNCCNSDTLGEYLHHVEELNFDELKYCANYLYVSTAKHPVNFNLTPDK
jgi:hypothetical protein